MIPIPVPNAATKTMASMDGIPVPNRAASPMLAEPITNGMEKVEPTH